MKKIICKAFRNKHLTGVVARTIHAFESPRFSQFVSIKENQGQDFLESVTNYEEKVALLNYGQSVGNPDLEKIASGFRSSPEFNEFKQVLLSKIPEMTPHTLSQFIRVYINNLTQSDVDAIVKRLGSFFDSKDQEVNEFEMDFVFDSINYLIWVTKFANRGINMAQFDAGKLEEFYLQNSPKMNLVNQTLFASLYRQQNGYKKSRIESILKLAYAKRAYLDTTKFLNVLMICFEEIMEDAVLSKKKFTNKALRLHALFPLLEKFDQAELIHSQAPSIAKDKFLYVLNIMNICKVEDSLPHVSEFLYDIFRNLIVIGTDIADILVFGNLLLNQKIDIAPEEANALASQITAYLSKADELPTELLAVLFLSKQAAVGM